MATATRWVLGVGLAMMLTVGPFVYYRAYYTDMKRLRVVEPGVLYRSGQLSADGFITAIDRLGIRTIINAQDELADPDVAGNLFNSRTIRESELCKQLCVRYVHLPPDLVSRRTVPGARPGAIERFLEIMDDPANHPVLIHCRAGLHRTGVLCAVYRMEYQGWSQLDAMAEMKEHGFGQFFCTTANDYVTQYVLTFQPGRRKVKSLAE
ncbi:hypothetical protein AYO44_03010 [Planctomycetaceae bacterium SCGC AG-212-F19]|nr:hypothetical protein AYO44_03010 [Planctomycetaceae bacterium SCGC AG-212-F19]